MSDTDTLMADLLEVSACRWAARQIRFLSEPGSPWVELDDNLWGYQGRRSILASAVNMVTIGRDDTYVDRAEKYEVVVWCVGMPPQIVAGHLSLPEAEEVASVLRAQITIRRLA